MRQLLEHPAAQLPEQQIISRQIISYFGMDYFVPTVTDWPGTVIAVAPTITPTAC